MEPTSKLQDLEVNMKYKVLGRKEIKTDYGKSYILKVIEQNEPLNEFNLYSTKYLTNYIDKEFPKGPFEFTVKIFRNGKKCPVIENYNPYSDNFIPF
jgi:phosphorylcholine metabolism protein LicD